MKREAGRLRNLVGTISVCNVPCEKAVVFMLPLAERL